MLKFLRAFAFPAAGLAVWFASAAGQPNPDPADSIIIESRATAPFDSACNKPGLKVRVYITNKDSVAALPLLLKTVTTGGGLYGTLSRSGLCARSSVGHAFNFLFPPDSVSDPPNLLPRLQSKIANYSGYNSSSRDDFLFALVSSNTAERFQMIPPNLLRAVLGEIKFDSLTLTPPIPDRPAQFDIDTGNGAFMSPPIQDFTQFVDKNGNAILVNFVKGIITTTLGDVQEINPGQIPRAYALSQNYPNPFNANTQISFALPKAGQTRLDIYNVLGQKVSTLFDEYMTAGTKTVNWDGRDDHGVAVPSGVYFYKLVSQDFRQTKKMLLIK